MEEDADMFTDESSTDEFCTDDDDDDEVHNPPAAPAPISPEMQEILAEVHRLTEELRPLLDLLPSRRFSDQKLLDTTVNSIIKNLGHYYILSLASSKSSPTPKFKVELNPFNSLPSYLLDYLVVHHSEYFNKPPYVWLMITALTSRLDLDFCQVGSWTQEDIDRFFDLVIKHCSLSLRQLIIKLGRRTPTFEKLSYLLSHLLKLEGLEVKGRNTIITPDSQLALILALPPTLKALLLDKMALTQETCLALPEQCPNLKLLEVGERDRNNDEAQLVLSTVLMSFLPKLKLFYWGSKNYHLEEMATIARTFPNKRLDYEVCTLGDEDYEDRGHDLDSFRKVMEVFPNVNSLVYGYPKDEAEIEAVADITRGKLSSVRICDCKISPLPLAQANAEILTFFQLFECDSCTVDIGLIGSQCLNIIELRLQAILTSGSERPTKEHFAKLHTAILRVEDTSRVSDAWLFRLLAGPRLTKVLLWGVHVTPGVTAAIEEAALSEEGVFGSLEEFEQDPFRPSVEKFRPCLVLLCTAPKLRSLSSCYDPGMDDGEVIPEPFESKVLNEFGRRHRSSVNIYIVDL